MKKFYYSLCLAIGLCACQKAEIEPVTASDFVDPLLFGYMQMNYDTNGDFIFQPDEVRAVTELDLSDQNYVFNIKGLEKFVELQSLNINKTNLQNKKLKLQNKKLKRLACALIDLEEIDVSNLTELEFLNVIWNNISVLDVTKNLKLQELWISGTPISSIDLSNNTKLREFSAKLSPSIIYVDFSNNHEIEVIEAFESGIRAIDLTGCSKLKTLDLQKCPLTELNINDCVSLESAIFQTSGNFLFLDISNNPNLKSLEIGRVNDGEFTIVMKKDQVVLDLYVPNSVIERI